MLVQVEKLALEKWGGQEKLDAERAKRHEKRLDRERAKAGMPMHKLRPSIGCLEYQAMHWCRLQESSALGWPHYLASCDTLVI